MDGVVPYSVSSRLSFQLPCVRAAWGYSGSVCVMVTGYANQDCILSLGLSWFLLHVHACLCVCVYVCMCTCVLACLFLGLYGGAVDTQPLIISRCSLLIFSSQDSEHPTTQTLLLFLHSPAFTSLSAFCHLELGPGT